MSRCCTSVQHFIILLYVQTARLRCIYFILCRSGRQLP
jgi:hypothetical protein